MQLRDKGHTPIKFENLSVLLEKYPLQKEANELYHGFKEGFRLNYTGPRQHFECENLKSVFVLKDETMEKINKEVKLGRILGPFSKLPISTLRVSPIGQLPEADGWRLITNLFFPFGSSVNSYINEEYCKVQYSSLDQILDKIFDLGPFAKLGRMDIKSTFRLLIVNPADFDLLGIKLNGKYYIDKCLPLRNFLVFYSGLLSTNLVCIVLITT